MNIPVLLGLMLCGVVTAAGAEDCSQGPIPDQAPVLSIGGKSWALPVATMGPNGNTSSGSNKFDGFMVTLQDKAGDGAAAIFAVQILVPEGQLPDGKTFRQLPTSESASQAATSDHPEIGTWFTDGSALPMLSQVGNVVSLRIEIGQRDSSHTPAVVPVGILFCAPKQGDIKAPMRLAGKFRAEIKRK